MPKCCLVKTWGTLKHQILLRFDIATNALRAQELRNERDELEFKCLGLNVGVDMKIMASNKPVRWWAKEGLAGAWQAQVAKEASCLSLSCHPIQEMDGTTVWSPKLPRCAKREGRLKDAASLLEMLGLDAQRQTGELWECVPTCA